MSYADVRRELARQEREAARKARKQLPPRKPAPAEAKEKLERIRAQLEAKAKDAE